MKKSTKQFLLRLGKEIDNGANIALLQQFFCYLKRWPRTYSDCTAFLNSPLDDLPKQALALVFILLRKQLVDKINTIFKEQQIENDYYKCVMHSLNVEAHRSTLCIELAKRDLQPVNTEELINLYIGYVVGLDTVNLDATFSTVNELSVEWNIYGPSYGSLTKLQGIIDKSFRWASDTSHTFQHWAWKHEVISKKIASIRVIELIRLLKL